MCCGGPFTPLKMSKLLSDGPEPQDMSCLQLQIQEIFQVCPHLFSFEGNFVVEARTTAFPTQTTLIVSK